MSAETLKGIVTRFQSGFYNVQTAGGMIVCKLRGRLKRRSFQGDVISIGDNVAITHLPDGSGVIEAIEPRARELARLDPT
ncbi:MAG TPA: hypothetical protein PK558_05710, partial [Anaerolineaceae bacterium]|nr:hypothetical protein [Anaerolineaceae bacterium]